MIRWNKIDKVQSKVLKLSIGRAFEKVAQPFAYDIACDRGNGRIDLYRMHILYISSWTIAII
jgi:hypothetical protein